MRRSWQRSPPTFAWVSEQKTPLTRNRTISWHDACRATRRRKNFQGQARKSNIRESTINCAIVHFFRDWKRGWLFEFWCSTKMKNEFLENTEICCADGPGLLNFIQIFINLCPVKTSKIFNFIIRFTLKFTVKPLSLFHVTFNIKIHT